MFRVSPAIRLMDSGSRPTILGLIALPLALASGCVAVVPYQPRDGLVQELGDEQARSRLRDVAMRARVPQISAVEVTDENIRIKSQHSSIGPFWQEVRSQIPTDIYYSNPGRLELYANNYVFIYGPGGAVQLKVLFNSMEDAQEFMDLVSSFVSQGRADS